MRKEFFFSAPDLDIKSLNFLVKFINKTETSFDNLKSGYGIPASNLFGGAAIVVLSFTSLTSTAQAPALKEPYLSGRGKSVTSSKVICLEKPALVVVKKQTQSSFDFDILAISHRPLLEHFLSAALEKFEEILWKRELFSKGTL